LDRIYLDHAATTPVHPDVAAAMTPWMAAEFGNPSSLHAEGRRAREAVDEARLALSERLGCLFAEVIFTSSGTEAANLAILGAALGNPEPRRNRVLMSAAEHHCVLHTAPILERLGYAVERVRVDRYARLDLEDLAQKLGDDVLLVCAMHANNEVGTLQPILEVSDLVKKTGALLFCDAVQTLAAVKGWTVDTLGVDLLAASAHKVQGPKGVGALYIRAGTPVKPWTVGGGQEREMRAGTENVAAIVGFAKALSQPLMSPQREARDSFLAALEAGGAVRTVPETVPCLDGHAHVRFPGASAESMLILLDRMGVSASSGAACSSGSLEPSHVLLACGYSEAEAKEGLRFTFGEGNTVEEGLVAAERVLAALKRVATHP